MQGIRHLENHADWYVHFNSLIGSPEDVVKALMEINTCFVWYGGENRISTTERGIDHLVAKGLIK